MYTTAYSGVRLRILGNARSVGSPDSLCLANKQLLAGLQRHDFLHGGHEAVTLIAHVEHAHRVVVSLLSWLYEFNLKVDPPWHGSLRLMSETKKNTCN